LPKSPQLGRTAATKRAKIKVKMREFIFLDINYI
jgi:hypothetical protein